MIRFLTPIGMLEVESQDGVISKLSFSTSTNEVSSLDPLLLQAKKELLEYFAGSRKEFSLPLKKPQGSSFSNKALTYLLTIPYGSTKSYQQQAIEIGHAKAHRAVGLINGKNQLPILIPCHRIVLSSGKKGGYLGGAKIKAWLLAHEKAQL